ncbi:glycosyltransferase family 4 protein [Candidatus Kuenenbacteria bacterium]|nr:glycosyltransferase family 4 protein [Candidatus Kuenenbacteria bacterium]
MNNSAKLKEKILGFFLTEKMSLKNWDKAGILTREIAPYNILAQYFKKIYLFTYDGREELHYAKYLAPNIEIVYKKWRMRARDYRWLLPFLNWKKVRECNFWKTNQLKARAALVAKIIKPRGKLILRTGWTQSLFQVKQKGKADKKIIWWERIAYALADAALVTSEGDRQYLLEKYKIKPEKIEVIANYIDTDKFAPETSDKHDRRITYSGKIEEQKNLNTLIRALEGTDIALDIIGGPMDEKSELLKKELERLAEGLKVELTFTGRRPNDELPKLLNKYKIYVLPSLYEGMPKSLLEAMSMGLACIGTRVEGTKEIIKDGETGLLTENNFEDIRKKILSIINDDDRQRKLGESARRFVVDNFSLKTQINKEINIYEKLISKN